MSDWETIGAPATPDDGWETVKPPPKTDWQQFKSFIPKLPFGEAIESALALGSGAIATPLAGLAGLGGAMIPDNGNSGDRVQRVQNALTYEPVSKGAQTLTHIAAWPGEKIAQAGDWAGGKVTDITGSPALGAQVNTAVNAVPFALGGASKAMIPSGATDATWAARNAERVKNMHEDAALLRAKDAGLAVPPTQVTKPGFINSALEWYAGKPQTAQVASVKNQPKLQDLVRKDFGEPPTSLLDKQTYDFVRSEAGKAYEAVKNTGESPVSPEFTQALANMADPFEKRARAYPKDPRPPILKEIESAGEPIINADAAIEKVKDLRNEASKAGSGERADKAYAGQLRELANAVENEVELHLERTGQPPELIQNFRDARRTIAKTYTAEKATMPSGEINAVSLARDYKKGLLDKGMEQAGDFGANFPRAAQLPTRVGGGPSSAFEALGSIMSPKKEVLGAIIGRHKLRDLLVSNFYQKHMVNPGNYGPTMGDAMVRGLSEPGVAALTESLGQQDAARKRAMLEQLLR